MKKIYFVFSFLLIAFALSAQPIKVLFDATKAEMAGNADWVIDADLFNLGVKTGGSMATGYGNEANPQRIPTPAQSGITANTSEAYWKGGLSAWGVELAKMGYTVESLPYNGLITYGNASNVQDLTNYKIFVICEPNIVFTTAQKQAIINFVNNGGGLFMVADHNVSDRNNDGWDSPHIFNDLMTNNGIVSNPFGISFDYQNFSQTTSNYNSLPLDPVLHGPKGNPTQLKFSNGTSMTLNTTANSSVKGLIYKTGSSFGTANVLMAHAHYGNGKVVAIGDSSPCDDGTGDTNDVLYCGWSCEVNGDHARLFLNASIWLTTTTASPYKFSSTSTGSPADVQFQIYPNPSSGVFNFNSNIPINSLVVSDLSGRIIYSQKSNDSSIEQADLGNLDNGIYIVVVNAGNESMVKRIIISR